MKPQTREIVQLNYLVPAKTAATELKRAEQLAKRVSKKTPKIRLIIPGLTTHRDYLWSVNVKCGPKDHKTGAIKYQIIRLKLHDKLKVIKQKAAPRKMALRQVGKRVIHPARRAMNDIKAVKPIQPPTEEPTQAPITEDLASVRVLVPEVAKHELAKPTKK